MQPGQRVMDGREETHIIYLRLLEFKLAYIHVLGGGRSNVSSLLVIAFNASCYSLVLPTA